MHRCKDTTAIHVQEQTKQTNKYKTKQNKQKTKIKTNTTENPLCNLSVYV